MKQTEFKDVDPPFWVAWNQALASLRVRFLRQLITSVGIALGIAFFASIQTMRYASSADPSDEARLKWLVGTSLVMCLVGVTNSMLMSVTERYREIGTFKCLGASDGFIVKVFFLEAMMLGLAGSSVGATVGSLIVAAVLAFGGSHILFGQVLAVVLQGTILGMVLTVSSAIAPAIQAAKMPAAAALRVDL